jgi:hypothetical protein
MSTRRIVSVARELHDCLHALRRLTVVASRWLPDPTRKGSQTDSNRVDNESIGRRPVIGAELTLAATARSRCHVMISAPRRTAAQCRFDAPDRIVMGDDTAPALPGGDSPVAAVRSSASRQVGGLR